VLGLREGATENAAVVRALLADLIERGLDANRSLLIVIDGAKALHKAVDEVCGRRALIQRCREHKKRNVTDALPERLRAAARNAMNQAYATRDAGRARRLLDYLARRLEHQHRDAAASLREGLEETLMVMRLGLPENLERVLSSTNLIENLFSRMREIGRQVITPAERHYGVALDPDRRARRRARLPQNRRLSCHADPGRRAARSPSAVRSYRAQA
jgi:putative transposase